VDLTADGRVGQAELLAGADDAARLGHDPEVEEGTQALDGVIAQLVG